MVNLCFTAVNSTWTNRINYNNFADNSWKNLFQIDTWDNSLTCCNNPLVSPTYNNLDMVFTNSSNLALRVRPVNANGILAYSSSISTFRNDILYGSFRVSAKVPNITGTSIGFFFFYTITEEIDLEILTRELPLKRVRTAVQPITRDVNGKSTSVDNKIIKNNKSLSDNYIEYRFDWFPERVDYYMDNIYYNSFNVNIPINPGKFVINHRSNGNPDWSRGPPISDSDLLIQYVDFYFNSSSDTSCQEQNIQPPFIAQESNFQNWKRYTASIIVGSIFGFIILLAVGIAIYRKYFKKKEEGITENPVIFPNYLNTIPETQENEQEHENISLYSIIENNKLHQERLNISPRRP